MEQTAVEWLIKRYHDYGTLYYEDMTKAKEMEKAQISEAYRTGVEEDVYNNPLKTGEEYFNETYNKVEPTQSKEPTPEAYDKVEESKLGMSDYMRMGFVVMLA